MFRFCAFGWFGCILPVVGGSCKGFLVYKWPLISKPTIDRQDTLKVEREYLALVHG